YSAPCGRSFSPTVKARSRERARQSSACSSFGLLPRKPFKQFFHTADDGRRIIGLCRLEQAFVDQPRNERHLVSLDGDQDAALLLAPGVLPNARGGGNGIKPYR